MARFPMPSFPRGWFAVGFSADLAPGEMQNLTRFGHDLVLYRTESGVAVLTDAYCPHLGAHLGHGGKICGETIECPFHAWRFGPSGRCEAIPYATKIPPKALLRTWPLRDLNGLLIAYHDEAGLPPAFEPLPILELSDPNWLPAEVRTWEVRSHVQELNENNTDSAHLKYVHGLLDAKSTGRPDNELFHIHHRITADMSRMGMKGKTFEGDVIGTHCGLGILQQRFRIMLVEALLVSMMTPLDEDRVHLTFAFTVKKAPSEQVAKMVGMAMYEDIINDVTDDMRIWEHKVYRERPVLCDGDGPIGMMRRWAKQFYGPGPALDAHGHAKLELAG